MSEIFRQQEAVNIKTVLNEAVKQECILWFKSFKYVTVQLIKAMEKPQRERRRPPSMTEDYYSDSPAGSISDISDTDQADIAKMQNLELTEILEELYGPGDCPPSVSHWNSACNDALIRKRFKMVRRLVSSEDFSRRYFWAGQEALFEKWQTSSDVQGLLTFAEMATAAINMSENELFLPGNVEPQANREQIAEDIANASCQLLELVDRLQLYNKTMSMNILLNRPEVYHFETPRYTENALQMRTGLHRWMMFLSRVVERSPATIKERAYQQVFEKYLDAFYIDCVNGDMEKFGIPYRNGQISCVPDILLSLGGQRASYSGVVEVKRMALDPSFKHAFGDTPTQGILRDEVGEVDEADPPKKRRVNFPSDEGSSHDLNPKSAAKTEHNEEKEGSYPHALDDHDSASASNSGMGGSKLPDWMRNLIKIFFGQLFGSVLALEFHQSDDKAKQRLGIGVVGFRIIFFTFYARPNINFSKIPQQQNSRIEVDMTRPLCILNAKDRVEISKILLQIAVKKPLKSTSSK